MKRMLIIAVTFVAGCIFLAVLTFSWWTPLVVQQLMARSVNEHEIFTYIGSLEIQPRNLAPTTTTARSVSFESFSYEIPTELAVEKTSDSGASYRISEDDRSKFILVNRGMSFDTSMVSEQIDVEFKKIFPGGNYETQRSILSMTLDQISWLDGREEAVRNITRMRLKQLLTVLPPQAIYEFTNSYTIRGFELPHPRATEVFLFDQEDRPLNVMFKGFTQSEIDTFLESVKNGN